MKQFNTGIAWWGKVIRVSIGAVLLVVLGNGLMQLNAGSVRATSSRRFEKHTSKFAVVMFYQEGRDFDRQAARDIKSMFNNASEQDLYERSSLRFVRVNVAKDNGADIAASYNVTGTPTFVLFKYGVPIRGVGNNVIKLNGRVSDRQLSAFIDKHLRNDLEKLVKERAKRKEEAREESRYRSYYRPYWGGGYGYPYYGHSYSGHGYWPYYGGGYYNRPYGGIGFQFGW